MTAAPTGPEPRTDAAMEGCGIAPAQSGDVLDDLWWTAGRERDIRHDRTEGETT